jgi:hypothetical protein
MNSLIAVVACLVTAVAGTANAHSASDAYLTLDIPASTDAAKASTLAAHVQWDIALRDLDFVMKLDDDGDGRIVWKELRGHQDQLARYALDHIAFRRNGKPCSTRLTKQLVDDHADGAYAALFFDVLCVVGPPAPLTLDYRLFFAIDPSHRAILVSRDGDDTATALLAPQNARIELATGRAPGR